MRHHNKKRKFGRIKKQRTALLRSLALALIANGKIKTTLAKAKELRPYVEKLITKSKNDSLSSRRIVSSRLGGSRDIGAKLFSDIGPKYKEKSGGYTRISKLTLRRSDASKMAIIELI